MKKNSTRLLLAAALAAGCGANDYAQDAPGTADGAPPAPSPITGDSGDPGGDAGPGEAQDGGAGDLPPADSGPDAFTQVKADAGDPSLEAWVACAQTLCATSSGGHRTCGIRHECGAVVDCGNTCVGLDRCGGSGVAGQCGRECMSDALVVMACNNTGVPGSPVYSWGFVGCAPNAVIKPWSAEQERPDYVGCDHRSVPTYGQAWCCT